jgi:type II secretory pathway pseudopilin PulG
VEDQRPTPSLRLPALSKAEGSVSSSPRPERSRRVRRAFTVIELLIVIGIITLLVTFLFYAYNHVVNDTKIRDTRTAMETANALLNNYEQATQFTKTLPTLYSSNFPWTGGASVPPNEPFVISFWTGGFTGSGEPAAGNINPGSLKPGDYPQQIIDTICVMYALEALPENQTILNNIPTNKKESIQVNLTSTPSASNTPVQVTLLLDGWGNPILFVPADGLYGVVTSADPSYNTSLSYVQGNQIVYPGKGGSPPFYTFTCVNPQGVSGTPPTNPPPSAINTPDATPPNWGGLCNPNELRPFWVSAGPDGDISNARGDPKETNSAVTHDDDNVYSFNN